MAANVQNPNASTSQPSPPPFAPAICRVAVAQICLNAGYDNAQPAALRALSDIAARYIRLLATETTSAANSRGRTQANIFDLAIVLKGLLRSSALRELRAFVAVVDEIPFAQPIARRRIEGGKMKPSFAQVGKELPPAYVPRWLPCFPEGWGKERDNVSKIAEKRREILVVEGRDMRGERERVRFKLGFGGEKVGRKKMKKIEIREFVCRGQDSNCGYL